MFYDPNHPYGSSSSSTGGIDDFGENSVQSDSPPLVPGDEGYWKLIGGIWRWMTEPLARTAVTS